MDTSTTPWLTSWLVPCGGRFPTSFHREGVSHEGTLAYGRRVLSEGNGVLGWGLVERMSHRNFPHEENAICRHVACGAPVDDFASFFDDKQEVYLVATSKRGMFVAAKLGFNAIGPRSSTFLCSWTFSAHPPPMFGGSRRIKDAWEG